MKEAEKSASFLVRPIECARNPGIERKSGSVLEKGAQDEGIGLWGGILPPILNWNK
jgi:hypothetical protein